MKRPDPEQVIKPLKSFQRATVEHAFDRLFVAPDSTSRFLVADEVGLGKTLVARGIIARVVDHLWDKVDRIDIIYICSNQNIARANMPKLQIGDEEGRSFALATRLTMLAHELAPREGERGRAENKVNFISFTPATSFQMGNSSGMARERRVLYHLLQPLIDRRKPLMNFLQGPVTRSDRWRDRLKTYPLDIEPSIRKRFEQAFRNDRDLSGRVNEVIETWFLRYRDQYPREARHARNRLLGELRAMLAKVCIDALEPDLIIVDEFQRFKTLLEERPNSFDPATELAPALFQAMGDDGSPVRTLLLSATPYKLYTADAEIEHEDHYEDFLATTRFLMGNDEARVQTLKRHLSEFGTALKRAAHGDASGVHPAKMRVEAMLQTIMARTERVSASEGRDAMVEEPDIRLNLEASDVRQYLAADALFKAVGDHDPMPFWKSAPYLTHFMHGYKFNERLHETSLRAPDRIVRVLKEHSGAFLQQEQVNAWRGMDPANAKLREMTQHLLDTGLWKLLWMPPTVPYWPLDGAYRDQEGQTKSLLFSAYNVVPDVISAVLSYEAERRMMGDQMQTYQNPDGRQSGLLRFTQAQNGKRSRHRLLHLLMPCLTLAEQAHPLSAPAGVDRRVWIRDKVEAMLRDPALPDPREGEVDDRWETAVLLLLDPDLRPFLEQWRDADAGEDGAVGDLPKPNPDVMARHLDDLLSLDPADLGRRPDGLAELVTDIALGAPGVLAARTLLQAKLDNHSCRVLSVQIANAFWKLFNRPAVIKLLQQLSAEHSDSGSEDTFYWRMVLGYCADGNLQAVLDEAWHLVWEQHAWSDKEPLESIARKCVSDLTTSIEPRPSRVHAHFYKANGSGGLEKEVIRLRTVLALRFGNVTKDEGALSQDAVRAAFNSPFRPFVLASTSIGQEGLDFHPWCHRLIHWNLPGNPVDMEQREGRVHRYKGHAVRKNVAQRHAAAAFSDWKPGEDLWSAMFSRANADARASGVSELVPYWMAPGDCRVHRHVPLLPYTREVKAFERLKRQLAAYRVVFGQPRQEELITLLERSDIQTGNLDDWAIDLTPRPIRDQN